MTQLRLVEKYNIAKAHAALNHKDLIDKSYNPSLVKSFLKKIIHNNGSIEVEYHYSKKRDDPVGRLYASGGIQNIPCDIRNYLLEGEGLFDIDIKNCANTIIYNLCKLHGIKKKYYSTVKQVVVDRDEIINRVYGGNKERFKDAITPLYFNSKEVVYKNNFEKEFHADLIKIQKKLSKIEEYSEYLNDDNNARGKMLSRIVYDWENRLIMDCIQKIEDETQVKPFAILHDGFIIGIEYDLHKLEAYIKSEYKFDIRFSYKKIENKITVEAPPVNYIMDYSLILDKHILEIADVIKPEIEKIMRYNDDFKKYYVYNDTTGVWNVSSDPDEVIARLLRKYTKQSLDDHKNNKPDSDDKTVLKKYNKDMKNIIKCNAIIDTPSFMSKLKDYLKRLILDNNFCKKFNKNLYQIAFKNGLYDMRTQTLRHGLFYDDFICNPLQFDYEPSTPEDRQRVKDIILKICNNTQAHMDYYLSILGYALTGDAEKEKAIWYFVGVSGNNGKTLIMDALKTICPSYAVMMNTKALTENSQNRHKHLNILNLAPRIIYLEELPKKGSLDTQIMKCLADGKSIVVEKMFGNTTEYDVVGKLFTLSNHTPIFDNDGGTANRYRQCQFNSEFHERFEDDDYEKLQFKVNTTLADILKNELKMALLDVLFEYAHDFYISGKKLRPMPQEWIEKTKETVYDNSIIKNYIEDHCEVGAAHKLDRDDADNICKLLHIQLSHFKDELSKISTVKYDRTARTASTRRGAWLGIKIKEFECDIDSSSD